MLQLQHLEAQLKVNGKHIAQLTRELHTRSGHAANYIADIQIPK